jgi:cytochrome c oxidase cbb3-type subunit 1
MWRAVDADGNLTYSFVETVARMKPYYLVRLAGGLVYFSGMVVMAYNLRRTVRGARAVEMRIPELSELAPAT